MLDVRHSIDNKHVKKNVCEATCGTLLQQKFKGKYHKNAREDLKDLGIRPELYAEEVRPSLFYNHLVKGREKEIL
jgi:hypothetical protein